MRLRTTPANRAGLRRLDLEHEVVAVQDPDGGGLAVDLRRLEDELPRRRDRGGVERRARPSPRPTTSLDGARPRRSPSVSTTVAVVPAAFSVSG